MKLSEKQKKFVDYYCSSGNATQSAIKAGYSEKAARATSSRMLTNANIISAIEKRNLELEDERIADITEIKKFWTEILRGDGVKSPNWYETKDRIKASELLAKTTGAFIEKVEHSGEINHTHSVLNNLSEDELRNISKLGGG
ncbi:terminase small subunit [Macrococcus animalis]|uniref:terminase small subunit n=1 Tax=Macrococcus animalis TaxID=3395467 RepID=UPI0039BEC360